MTEVALVVNVPLQVSVGDTDYITSAARPVLYQIPPKL